MSGIIILRLSDLPGPAPVAANGLADISMQRETGIQTLDASVDFTFTGTPLYSLTTTVDGVTIDANSGVISFYTSVLVVQSGTSIVVRCADAKHLDRFAETGFNLTVSEIPSSWIFSGSIITQIPQTAGWAFTGSLVSTIGDV